MGLKFRCLQVFTYLQWILSYFQALLDQLKYLPNPSPLSFLIWIINRLYIQHEHKRCIFYLGKLFRLIHVKYIERKLNIMEYEKSQAFQTYK
jgi:ribosomal 50S subunit-associated protein YjgA (DUF615 family)